MRVLAFDIGSSSTRAAIFSKRGRHGQLVAEHYQFRARDGAELSAAVLLKAARDCLRRFGSRKFDVIAACSFWHGLLGVDQKLRPLTPIYTWADARCMRAAEALRHEFDERKILQRTGCMLRFPFWPAKLCWLRREHRRSFERVFLWLSPADWILARLFGELATSESMASGTGLFDYTARTWDRELCQAAGVDQANLAAVSRAVRADEIFSAIGDGAAGNLGSSANEHALAINLGTSAAARLSIPRKARQQVPFGLFRYIIDKRVDVLGGAISNAGNVHAWCERVFGKQRLSRHSAAANPLVALPFLYPERSPDWPEAPAVICRLSAASKSSHIHESLVVAALYQLAEVIERIETICPIRRVIVSGGMTRARDVVKILADALGRNVELTTETEASLYGAAMHAFRQFGETLPIPKPGRLIRFDKSHAQQHRLRRRKQRDLLLALAKSR